MNRHTFSQSLFGIDFPQNGDVPAVAAVTQLVPGLYAKVDTAQERQSRKAHLVDVIKILKVKHK
jgi:hypothetical protein